MHQLIASYLFQNKTCPLPGLGNLSIHTSAATADFTTKQITAPPQLIQFDRTEPDATGLLNYVAAKTHSDTYEATEALDHFCDNIKNELSVHAAAALPGIGNFIVDNNGNMLFKQESLPGVFLQPVFAERVIHPKAEHHILVGDRETTNTVMSGYFTETHTVRNRWWVWAIILGALALAALFLYFNDSNTASLFGNAIKI